MNLDLFNNLFNDIKKENAIQNFMSELSGYMKKNTNLEKLLSTDEVVKKYNFT